MLSVGRWKVEMFGGRCLCFVGLGGSEGCWRWVCEWGLC